MALTRVTNVSGASKFFGFLPPHGLTLANNAYVTLDGDLRTILGSGGRSGRYNRSREIAALDEACDAGDICITEIAESCCSSSSA